LVAELGRLDAARQDVIRRIKAATDRLIGGHSPLPAPPVVRAKTVGRRKGYKMSEETKAKMRAAQQARWAKKNEGKASE
jgi:hypothetical protein